MAVGVDPPGRDGVWDAVPATAAVGAPPADAATPLACVPVPDPLLVPVGPGVVVAGGVPGPGEEAEPDDWAAIWGTPVGPAPRFSPTIDNAEAATAAAATNLLRTKYGLTAVSASGRTAAAGTSGGVWPNARDANTSSRVA